MPQSDRSGEKCVEIVRLLYEETVRPQSPAEFAAAVTRILGRVNWNNVEFDVLCKPKESAVSHPEPKVVLKNRDGEFLAGEEVEVDIIYAKSERWRVHEDQSKAIYDTAILRGSTHNIVVDKALVRKKRPAVVDADGVNVSGRTIEKGEAVRVEEPYLSREEVERIHKENLSGGLVDWPKRQLCESLLKAFREKEVVPDQDGKVGFMEAMTAARSGKRVRPTNSVGGEWLAWSADRLTIGDDRVPITVTARILDARWEVEQEAVEKTYPFLEAVEMMKAGKKMRPLEVSGESTYCRLGSGRVVEFVGGGHYTPMPTYVRWFEVPWVEVTP